MIVTIRSSSSELRSPALETGQGPSENGWKDDKRRKHSPLVEVNIGLLADDVRVAATNTFDLGQGVHDLALAIDVGIEQTKDVLELLVLLREYERHLETKSAIHPLNHSPTVRLPSISLQHPSRRRPA